MIKLKRIYEPAAPSDGVRILVERLWPRGVKKVSARLDQWAKEAAPSAHCADGFITILRGGTNSGIDIFESSMTMKSAGGPCGRYLPKDG